MRIAKLLLLIMTLTVFLTSSETVSSARTTQPAKGYQQMSPAEQADFVSTQAARIAREMSGRDYDFTPAFEADIKKALDWYVKRAGNGAADRPGKSDIRHVLERGQANAAVLTAAFRARNVSPLIGLYIPWIESEYINLKTPTPMGSLGMFQFLPKTGEHYGLSADDLFDVQKSADAAARYILDSMEVFKGDPMKEALALLAYNRGAHKTARDLKVLLNDQNRQCSICALSADRSKLDETFKYENVFYVPRFFAAAIIGENPHAFGLQTQPLSSY
ncbi:MAG TPA: transglycosylase SLT domain-containing protein [Pyrinomonadaceae bacterium]|nr:transglycosylase SLT domain-containing protein [Pyrinomonadaceae bacterium]